MNGTWSNTVGAAQCTNCSIGSFSGESGATECNKCGSDEYTLDVAAVTCMSCQSAGFSFALSQPDQCSTANSIILGSVVGGVLVIIIVTLVLILVLVNPKRRAKKPAQPLSNDSSVPVAGTHLFKKAELDKSPKEDNYQTDDDFLPQPPRPESHGVSDDKPTKGSKIVPKKKEKKKAKKQKWTSSGSRAIPSRKKDEE